MAPALKEPQFMRGDITLDAMASTQLLPTTSEQSYK